MGETSFKIVVGNSYDLLTPLLLELCESPYLNIGYWQKGGTSFNQAQQKLVDIFGSFCLLGRGVEILDVGFGTGEQDLFYAKKFKCKKIIGINISVVQVEMALEKIKNAPKLARTIQFKWGDAMRLTEKSPDTYDRVLALESAQMFDDKRAFLRGAHHVLRQGGYLCIAEPIPTYKFAFDEARLDTIRGDILKKIKINERYLERFIGRIQTCLQDLAGLVKSQKGWHVSYEEYLVLLKEEGFLIEEVRDISKQVFEFFPILTVKKRIVDHLNRDPTDQQRIDLLLSFLASSSFIKNYAFPNGLLGYYLIRAKKI